MPIPLPDLDNRTFTDLMEEMRALVPRYAPTWTDHNLSDPGITLLELFAWLTEAIIYRLNRIPQASEARFLQLLGATFYPAQPATATLGITAEGLEKALPLLRDTPLIASRDQGAVTLPFETTYDLQLTLEEPSSTVLVRQTVPAQDERLGLSNGQPHQAFPLAQRFSVLKTEGQFPLLPRVAVDGVAWAFRSDLLGSAADDTHFTFEPHLNAVRFGDGYLGKIPPAGAEITASYRHTLGRQGNLPAGGTQFRIDIASARLDSNLKQAIDAGVSFSILCEAGASGGTDPTGLDEAQDQAIGALKSHWRAITAEDFEELVLGEELQKLISERTGLKLARARCLPEWDLTDPNPEIHRSGHVSVIIVPYSEDEAGNKKPQKPSSEMITYVWNFLDQRRLITCRHHVVGPEYTTVWVKAGVVRHSQTSEEEVRGRIITNLEGFFDPLQGGPDAQKKGWPFGRDVYASEIDQVIEGTQGVDHVDSLQLYTRDDEGDQKEAGDRVAVAPNNLVHFDSASSQITLWASR